MALIQATDMSYLGFFSLPHFAGSPEDNAHLVDYGGMGLGMGPDGTSLYIGGYDVFGGLARFTIPAISGTASVVTDMVQVPGTFDVSSNGVVIGGTLVWNSRLIVTKFGIYAFSSDFRASHASATTALGSWTTPQANNAPIPRTAAGFLGIIPSEWRTDFDKPCVIGMGPTSIAENGTPGPALFGFDPDDVDGTGTLAVLPYLYHTIDHAIWQPTNMLGGVAWIDDSVIFIGTSGAGSPAYYQPPPDAPDACAPQTSGYHDYPYDLHAWAYDASDLLAVKNGTMDPWEPTWYAHWTLPGYNSSPCGRIIHRGGVYDPATGRYYLCQAFGETPRVHVWEIGTPAPSSNATVVRVYPAIF